MKQDGKPIDWATAVLCWEPARPAEKAGRNHFPYHDITPKIVCFIGGAVMHWQSTPSSGGANTERLASSAKDDHKWTFYASEASPSVGKFAPHNAIFPRTSISSLKILTISNELYVFVKYLKTERKLQNLQIFYISRSFLSDLSKINTNVQIFYLQIFVQFLYQLMYCCWWFFLSGISVWNVSQDCLCVMDGLLLAGQQQVIHHRTTGRKSASSFCLHHGCLPPCWQVWQSWQ